MSDILAANSIVDPVIAGLLVGAGTEQVLVGEAILPPVPVIGPGETFKYHTFGKEALRKPISSIRGVGGNSRRVRWEKDSASGKVVEHSLYASLDEREIEAENGFDVRTEVTMVPRGQVLTEKEFNLAAVAKDNDSYHADHITTDLNFGTGDIVTAYRAAGRAIKRKIGFRPGLALLSAVAFDLACENQYVIAKLGDDERKLVDEVILAKVLHVERVVVADSVYFDEDDDGTDIWGDIAGLYFVNPMRGKRNPSWGYNFYKPYGGLPWQVRRAFDTDNNELMFYKERYEPKAVFPEAAWLWENTDQA